MEADLTKKAITTTLAVFYICAGLYHFINPSFYLKLIPDYLPQPYLINYTVGGIELILGCIVLSPKYRKFACYAIILLLIVLIPSHIFFIAQGSCVEDGLCVPEWVSWGRLLLIHPLLMYWAYAVSKN
jgi:uncharacterized membrane protein